MKEISNRVMLLGKWCLPKSSRSVMMRAACNCAGDDCDIHIDLEYDKDFKTMDMIFSKNVYFFDDIRDPETAADNLRNIFHRIKKAIKLIFTGYLEMNEDFIFIGEDQINSFISALQQGKEYIKKEEPSIYYCNRCKSNVISHEEGFCDPCGEILNMQ